jgi:hypothetical protein
LWELRVRKSAIRVQAVQVQEEPKEAAVNKREGRDNAANLKGMMQWWRWVMKEDKRWKWRQAMKIKTSVKIWLRLCIPTFDGSPT